MDQIEQIKKQVEEGDEDVRHNLVQSLRREGRWIEAAEAVRFSQVNLARFATELELRKWIYSVGLPLTKPRPEEPDMEEAAYSYMEFDTEKELVAFYSPLPEDNPNVGIVISGSRPVEDEPPISDPKALWWQAWACVFEHGEFFRTPLGIGTCERGCCTVPVFPESRTLFLLDNDQSEIQDMMINHIKSD